MKNNSVLITGGGGFIGSHLSEHYLKENYSVIVVDNFCTGLKSNVNYLKTVSTPDRLCVIEADVSKPWEWVGELNPDLLKNLKYVFHLASPASPPLYQEMAFDTLWVNSVGLNRALEFADSVGARLIYSSTSEVYGDPDCSPQPETYWGNVNSFGIRSCYDESKRFGEALLFTHNWKKKTRHGLVRIFNTYGTRMNPHDGRVIINFLIQAEKGQSLTVYGDGRQTRSFCYVTDLVAGLTRYAASEITEPVNLGNDREFSILELAKEVQALYPEKKLQIEFKPVPADDPKQRKPDLARARKMLSPWAPTVSLKDGLRLMKEGIAW